MIIRLVLVMSQSNIPKVFGENYHLLDGQDSYKVFLSHVKLILNKTFTIDKHSEVNHFHEANKIPENYG